MIADSHNVALMNFLIVYVGIPDRISNLPGLYILNLLKHRLLIRLRVRVCHKIDEGSDSLGNRPCRDDDDLFILHQRFRLVRGQHDIFIVGEYKDSVRIYLVDGIQHVFRTWVHGLAALDDVICSQLFKDSVDSLPDRHGDKAKGLPWLLGLFFFLLFFRLLCRHFLRVADQFLLVLLAHIVYLHM